MSKGGKQEARSVEEVVGGEEKRWKIPWDAQHVSAIKYT
jgi:hypothetical protein